ncbi:MAG: hypothetical protein V3W44_09890 [Dehalococcoidales bacterium]
MENLAERFQAQETRAPDQSPDAKRSTSTAHDAAEDNMNPCVKCQGLLVPDKERDHQMGMTILIMRCVNCGKRIAISDWEPVADIQRKE